MGADQNSCALPADDEEPTSGSHSFPNGGERPRATGTASLDGKNSTEPQKIVKNTCFGV